MRYARLSQPKLLFIECWRQKALRRSFEAVKLLKKEILIRSEFQNKVILLTLPGMGYFHQPQAWGGQKLPPLFFLRSYTSYTKTFMAYMYIPETWPCIPNFGSPPPTRGGLWRHLYPKKGSKLWFFSFFAIFVMKMAKLRLGTTFNRFPVWFLIANGPLWNFEWQILVKYGEKWRKWPIFA